MACGICAVNRLISDCNAASLLRSSISAWTFTLPFCRASQWLRVFLRMDGVTRRKERSKNFLNETLQMEMPVESLDSTGISGFLYQSTPNNPAFSIFIFLPGDQTERKRSTRGKDLLRVGVTPSFNVITTRNSSKFLSIPHPALRKLKGKSRLTGTRSVTRHNQDDCVYAHSW